MSLAQQRFDADTGAEFEDQVQRYYDRQVVMSLAEAQAVAAMTSTRGWGVLLEFITGSVEANKNRLVTETDPTRVVRLQERTQAFLQVLGLVTSRVAEASVEAQQQAEPDGDEDNQPGPDDSPDNQE